MIALIPIRYICFTFLAHNIYVDTMFFASSNISCSFNLQELMKVFIGFIDVAGLYFALTQLTHRNISQNHKFQAVGLGKYRVLADIWFMSNYQSVLKAIYSCISILCHSYFPCLPCAEKYLLSLLYVAISSCAGISFPWHGFGLDTKVHLDLLVIDSGYQKFNSLSFCLLLCIIVVTPVVLAFFFS